MIPTAFNEENALLDPPKGVSQENCESISVFIGHTQQGVPITVSCWKVTKEELATLQCTGRIWLAIMGHNMPPVYLTTDNPLE